MNAGSDPAAGLTLRQLRAFVTIADTGSFVAASRRLSLTASALSLLIREMERTLAVRLFQRTTRRTELSLAGNEFYPLARKLLEDLRRAVESTQDLEQKKRGTVRIACTPLYASTLMPRLIQGYREQFPAVSVYLLDSLNQPALARVISGEADIAVAPHRPPPPELEQQSLFKDRFVMICKADHPLLARKRLKWAQVLKEPFVSLTADFTAHLQTDLFRFSDQLVLHPAHSVSFLTTALGMVEWGHGITAQPGSAAKLIAPFGLVAKPICDPVVYRHVSLYYKRALELSPAAASFRDFLQRFFAGGAASEVD